jgi:T4 RnlA family RNA ligase
LKIDLKSIDQSNFIVKEGIFFNQPAFLVIPNHIGAKYTRETLMFRSSVWYVDGTLASASFKKFFNHTEQPDLYPNPDNFQDQKVLEKIDGSTLILDVKDGQISMRTRGTFSYKTQENFADFELFLTKYPNFIEAVTSSRTYEDFSYLFEIVTPNNKIVINYPEVDFYLIDIINKNNYEYVSRGNIYHCAKTFDFKIPKTYDFNSLDKLANDVKLWTGCEGVVLTYNNNQDRIKIKSDDYIAKHKMKSSLDNFDHLVDLFFVRDMPEYSNFFAIIEKEVDFETANGLKGSISRICDAYKEVLKIVDGMTDFLAVRTHLSRKELALDIISSYGNTNRAAFLFTLKDRKCLDKDNLKKLLYQCL